MMLTKTKHHHKIDVHLVPLSTLNLAIEAPKGANLTVRNSSAGSPLTDAELKASINSVGLIRPLLFKHWTDGKDYIVSGNRRLRLMREIFELNGDQKNTDTEPMVQVQNIDDFGGDWREIAMDENLSLPPHLVERYELIVALTKDHKLSPEDARLRFGMTERQFNQVMALGKMAPVVRNAWKAGEISAGIAQTFTLEPDVKEQEKIFESLKKGGKADNMHFVSERIVPHTQRLAHKLVAFVGLDACRKAKLIKQEDFFSDRHIIADTKVLNKLAGDKLAERCKQLTEDGWAWAVPVNQLQESQYQHGHLEPTKNQQVIANLKQRLQQRDLEEAEYQTFERELEQRQREAYTPEQRAKSGCILEIGHNGALEISYGRVKPADKKAIERADRAKQKKQASAANSPAKSPTSPAVISNSLHERLSEMLQNGVAGALKGSPDVAVAALIAGFGSSGEVIGVKIKNDEGGHSKNPEADFVSIFESAVKNSPETRVVMLTQIAMQALNIVIYNVHAKHPLKNRAFQSLVDRLKPADVQREIAACFDAEDYFGSIGIALVADAVREAMGSEHADKVRKMKKSAAVQFAVEHVVKAGWLPPQLRTEHYKGPVGSKKKAKASPVKKAKKTAKKK
jgi:ParB family transcriptional regulator, chromosome partitioning protein